MFCAESAFARAVAGLPSHQSQGGKMHLTRMWTKQQVSPKRVDKLHFENSTKPVNPFVPLNYKLLYENTRYQH
jgi:hypothetical protein